MTQRERERESKTNLGIAHTSLLLHSSYDALEMEKPQVKKKKKTMLLLLMLLLLLSNISKNESRR